MNQKIDNIESVLAHHESQIRDLSDMISLQWKEIERLKIHLQKTNDKISEMESSPENQDSKSVAEIAASEKPPHY